MTGSGEVHKRFSPTSFFGVCGVVANTNYSGASEEAQFFERFID
jgi:hypothetical protein